MRLIGAPSDQLVRQLRRRGLGGYMRVGLAVPWVNIEAAFARVPADDLNPTAVRAFLTYQTEASRRSSATVTP
jgi:hypothetical protein